MQGRDNDGDLQDVCRRLRAGDAETFRSLVRRHHGRMLGVARALTGHAATAEDVVQETWLKVIEKLTTLDNPDALISWLYTILANTARRRATREGRIVLFAGTGEATEDGKDKHDMRSYPALEDSFTARGFWRVRVMQWDNIDPERIVAGRQLWVHVRAAIDDLPEGQRVVILLRDVEGLASADICRLLEISEGNLRVLLHRARTRLRCFLDDLLAGESAKKTKKTSR